MTRSFGRWMGWTALALVLAPALPATARSAADVVRVRCEPASVVAGSSVRVPVVIEIAAGWHVNANPPAPDYLIPTAVSVTGAAGLAPQGTLYPAGRQVKLGFDENPLSVYDGTVTASVTLAAARDALNGTHRLRGAVRYQSCNDEVCLAPTSLPFTVEVTVTGGATAPAGRPASGAGADTAAPAPAAVTVPAAATRAAPGAVPAGGSWLERWVQGMLARGGPWWWLGLLLGGLALNLTPCVFPMLGVTVSVFGARRKERPAKVMTHAAAYVLGIMITYSVLGVVAALTGGLFGSALQHPWVNVGLGVLFLALSLSMFGLYEMQPPVWLLQRLGGADTTSVLGILLSGLAVGIIAAPCVGPIILGVLVIIARHGGVLFGLRTMLVLSLGLGLPYLFLALFSNLIQGLPRSGDWMLWVKQVFGVLLVGIGLHFVFMGLAPRLGSWLLPAALALGGLYLGFVVRHGSEKPAFRRFKRVAGTLAVLAAIPAAMALRAGSAREGIRFEPYDEAAVQAALAAGRPVMLDFTADWCAACHELEGRTFTDRRVVERARNFAAFRVDLTRSDSPGVQALRARFGVAGLPAVLFVTRTAGEVGPARVVGFLAPGPFLERMEIAAARPWSAYRPKLNPPTTLRSGRSPRPMRISVNQCWPERVGTRNPSTAFRPTSLWVSSCTPGFPSRLMDARPSPPPA
jgi:thioredoxin:protein disulfide reductase